MELDRFEGRKRLQYRYYQTPDGEEYAQKLYWLVRPAIDLGFFLGVTDVMLVTRPIGWLPLIERFTRVSIRPIMTAFIFETTVYMATKLRKKDDGFNHVFGGLACGFYWSRFIAFYPISLPLTAFSCLALFVGKEQKMKGVEIHHDNYFFSEQQNYGAWSRFNKWNWADKYPRTWLTPEEAAAKGIET